MGFLWGVNEIIYVKCLARRKSSIKKAVMNIQEPLGTSECSPFPTGLQIRWLGPKEGNVLPKVTQWVADPGRKFGFWSSSPMPFLLDPNGPSCRMQSAQILTFSHFLGSVSPLGALMKYGAGAGSISDSCSLFGTLFRTRVSSARNLITPSILWQACQKAGDWLGGTRLPRMLLFVWFLLWILKSQS